MDPAFMQGRDYVDSICCSKKLSGLYASEADRILKQRYNLHKVNESGERRDCRKAGESLQIPSWQSLPKMVPTSHFKTYCTYLKRSYFILS